MAVWDKKVSKTEWTMGNLLGSEFPSRLPFFFFSGVMGVSQLPLDRLLGTCPMPPVD